MSEARKYEPIRYSFVPEEILELGEKLARECQLLADLEREKTQTAASVGARLKETYKRILELTTLVNNGYEIRQIECIELMENPRPGMKTIVRIDTNEAIRTEPMTMAEMQRSFDYPSEGDTPT